jgi:prolipoprotein diacylglyceryltransferase
MVGRLNGDTRFLLSLGTRTLEYATIYKLRRFSSLNDEQALNQVRAWQSGISFQGGLVVSMKTLVGIAYWRDPRTWEALDYDGPVSAKWGIRRLGNLPLPLETEVDLNV